jgi:hypothetical protein
LFFVLAGIGVDPGHWHDSKRYHRIREGNNRLTNAQSNVLDIILFALRVRGHSGNWPAHKTIINRDDWKEEVDRALSHPFVRAINEDGNVTLKTLDKYHQGLLYDDVVDCE